MIKGLYKTFKIFRFWYRKSKSFSDSVGLTLATIIMVSIFNQFELTKTALKVTIHILTKTKTV